MVGISMSVLCAIHSNFLYVWQFSERNAGRKKQLRVHGLLSFKFYVCYRHQGKLGGGTGQEWTHGVWLWAQLQVHGQGAPNSGSPVLMDRSVSLFPLLSCPLLLLHLAGLLLSRPHLRALLRLFPHLSNPFDHFSQSSGGASSNFIMSTFTNERKHLFLKIPFP